VPFPGRRKQVDLSDGPTTVSLDVDHGQFVVRGTEKYAEEMVDAYTEQARLDGVAVWDRGLAVFCDSSWADGINVDLELHEGRPEVDATGWNRITEVGLTCDSDAIHLYGPEGSGADETTVVLPPGTYGVLVAARGFGTTNEHGDDGSDSYRLDFWPVESLPERRLLKEPESK
jgi:hypothetical protein